MTKIIIINKYSGLIIVYSIILILGLISLK